MKPLPHLEKALPFLLPLGLGVLWEMGSQGGWIHGYLMPAPSRILTAGVNAWESGVMVRHVMASLSRVAGGFVLTAAAGIPLAFLFFRFRLWRKAFQPFLDFFQAVPPLAMVPLFILWLGIGEESKVAVIVMACFFPVFLGTLRGLEGVDPRWLQLGDSLKLPYVAVLGKILIPGALPSLAGGLRLGFAYGWRALLGAELFAAASGLGYFISDSQEMARTDRVYLGILLIGLLGLAFDGVLGALEKRLLPWREVK